MAAVLAPRPGVRRFVGDRASPSVSAGSGDLTVILPRDLCDGVGELSGESSLTLPMIGAGLPAAFFAGLLGVFLAVVATISRAGTRGAPDN
jgi:hypothetical protein